MPSRREFLAGGAGAGLLLLARSSRTALPVLAPASIPKYAVALPIPRPMPRDPAATGPEDDYTIAVRRFRQQMLPPGLPATTVLGYGSAHEPSTFATPARTIEARVGRPVRVRWVNELVDAAGRYLPHMLPVDPTLHWANPPGGPAGRDYRPEFAATPGPYRGPVPIVTHLHGGFSADYSDGHPEAWFLPAAANIPAGYAAEGSRYAPFAKAFEERYGMGWQAGSALYRYGNNQRAATLWFHDHVLGMTRINVYAGLAGFYLLRGGRGDLPAGVLPGPAPAPGDAAGTVYREIPVLIQDRSFAADGSLAYPAGRSRFDGTTGPYIPGSDVPPIWGPEFFGEVMVVNGATWPALAVEPCRYRLRLLNGCNSRFLDLRIVSAPPGRRAAESALPFWMIGSDGGFLPAPVELENLLLAPAERADVIVDFTGTASGTQLYLVNEGPDGPFQRRGGAAPADPAGTGQVLRFTVRALTAPDRSVPPDRLTLPPFTPIGTATVTRQVVLLESASAVRRGVSPVKMSLGVMRDGRPVAMMWSDPITENPALGAIEVWEIHNFTADAHPIHIHEVQLQLVNRQRFGGVARDPERWESGFKDTVIAYPKEVTRVRVVFDREGLFVWHCHMLEHEDNEMMRPYRIGG
ncbi:multicopper oxidase family protein [Sinosporangium siamense]|uniref:Multicopper oxidase n=1 Tax=Sinosporangium siamense TaxID=1367973 RepID=A0A919RP99_9ACTN|nr:multicopper oxidase [Sinosporangium siamense]GII96134.1 multicopper oxidase [Sinosporangium siamense]